MNFEAVDYLDKARENLEEAKKILKIGLASVAARSAYYAAFHAAEAFIISRTGKIAKSHSGVRGEFARFAKDEPKIDKTFSTFLAQAYKYKEIGDYGIGKSSIITAAVAEDAIKTAAHFVDCIAVFLAPSEKPHSR